MKTNLSHLLPVWKACEVLGEETVTRMVVSLLNLIHKSANNKSPLSRAAASNTNNTNNLVQLPQVLSSDEQVQALVHGLMYRHPPPKYPDTALPPTVEKAWKDWAALALDKQLLIRWLVPIAVQPHAGPSGHMGLFDCWVYALQNHGVSSNLSNTGSAASAAAGSGAGSGPTAGAASSTSASTSTSWMIPIPDVLILLAICKQYQDERHQIMAITGAKTNAARENNDEGGGDNLDHSSNHSARSHHSTGSGSRHSAAADEDEEVIKNRERVKYEKIVWCMSLLAFRIYDSYQKKGAVARDTIHRFLTDVYGEDSYKEDATIHLLDSIFDTVPMSEQQQQQQQQPKEDGDDGGDDTEEETKDDGVDNGDDSGGNNEEEAKGEIETPVAVPVPVEEAVVNRQQPSFARNLHATVAEGDFCRRILQALAEYSHTEFVLLDWVCTLACRMLPPPEIPDSVTAFLSALYSKPLPVCQMYGLPEHRLYEIKRRFHSLVKNSSPLVIQGDIMRNTEDTADADASAASQSSNRNSSSALQQDAAGVCTIPKQAISEAAFIDALCKPNDELGSGGYLPKSLSRLLFWNGCHRDVNFNNNNTSSSSNNDSNSNATPSPSSTTNLQGYWGLYHVLHFGCIAVRRNVTDITSHRNNNATTSGSDTTAITTINNQNTALLRFLFGMFQWATVILSSIDNNNGPADDIDEIDRTVLTRKQVAHMIVQLLEFSDYRRLADTSPLLFDETDDDEGPSVIPQQDKDMEEWLVDEDAAIVTGLLPSNIDEDDRVGSVEERSGGFIRLRALVNAALEGSVKSNEMSFNEFCKWGYSSTPVGGGEDDNKGSAQQHQQPMMPRLSTLLLELRLIASVQFGIPPSDASMEMLVIGEIEARHKERYPQSDVSRRGPRGTIWYLIDAVWLKNWAVTIKQQSRAEKSQAANNQSVSPSAAATTTATDHNNKSQINKRGKVTGNRGLDRISNTGLLASGGSLALRQDIRWKYDYEILPPLAWSGLQAWYDGGPPIYRSVVRYISSQATSPHAGGVHGSGGRSGPRIPTENELELYPFFVTVYLCDAASLGQARPFQQNYQLSRVSPILVMLVQLCKELDVDPESARLWVVENSKQLASSLTPTAAGSTKMSSSDLTSSSSGTGAASPTTADDWILSLEQNIVEQRKRRGIPSDKTITLLLEIKDKGKNAWPRGIDGKEWMSLKADQTEVGGEQEKNKRESDLGDGIVGLYNMGNTCYLNSSIQCLSHTPIFREYFTSKAYLKDVNKTNPLGHGGQLSQVSAVLINSLWKRFNQSSNIHQQPSNRVKAPGSYALVSAPSLTPKTFKESLGKFNEHFQGNEQHDAHELLNFLLAGLSEDLNRVVDKPYMEAPDSDGRPDSELADIWWSNHLKREMSVIIALFTGQYKSLLTCRTCSYESARFEPFTFIQVPLPEDDYLPVSLILYPLKDGFPTMKYCVRVKTYGRLRDVLVALAKILHADEIAMATASSPAESVGEDEKAEDETNKSEAFYSQLASNLAVVDMRDGYISKIAPNSWSLQDLQNKDTGELPLLHVYQLEPLSGAGETRTRTVATGDNSKEDEDDVDGASDGSSGVGHGKDNHDQSEISSEERKVDSKRGFLAVSQRRSEVISQDYLHPFAHRVFGTPLLLRVDALDKRTGRELYDLIARRIRNFVPKGAQRFLLAKVTGSTCNADNSACTSEPPSGDGDTEDTNRDSTDREGDSNTKRGSPTGTNRTTTDMEEVSAGSVPRYGFRIRLTTRDGRRCLTCPWYDCCIGCFIPDDDNPTIVMDGDSLVVDWHFAVDLATSGFGTRSSPMDPVSISSSQSSLTQPSTMRPKMYSAPVKNHSSCGTSVSKKMMGQAGVITLEDCLDAFAEEEKIPEAYCSKCKDLRVQMKRMSLWRLPPVVIIHLKRFQYSQQMRRKLRDLVIFPIEGLDLSRIMATDSQAAASVSGQDIGEEGQSPSASKENKGRDEMLYDLYGVVHHQGALSGGHYVASLKSELDGQWRLFNDAQIYEIHARDVVDASAYILFYIRRDAAKARLSDFWDVSGEGGVSEEDMEKLVKGRSDRCVIS